MPEDATNLRRMVRQKQYMMAFREQFLKKAKESDTFSMSTVLEMKDYLYSDCTAEQLSDVLNTVVDYQMVDLFSLEGEPVVGEKYMEYHVDKTALLDRVMEVFYNPVDLKDLIPKDKQ